MDNEQDGAATDSSEMTSSGHEDVDSLKESDRLECKTEYVRYCSTNIFLLIFIFQ